VALNTEHKMSLRDLVSDVADDARDLVRGEVALVRAEMEQKIDRSIAGLASLFGAMMLAFAGLVIVLLAAAQGLARIMPDWAASLIVGVVVLVIGGIMAIMARKALSPSAMVPDRTIRNVGADARAMKEHAT
jgi:hypothetical protein